MFGLHLYPPANSNREIKNLNPKAVITYKRPLDLGKYYKILALCKTKKHIKSVSGTCNHCALCGCHGKHNNSLVACVSQI